MQKDSPKIPVYLRSVKADHIFRSDDMSFFFALNLCQPLEMTRILQEELRDIRAVSLQNGPSDICKVPMFICACAAQLYNTRRALVLC